MAIKLLEISQEIKEAYDSHFQYIKKTAHLLNLAVCQNKFEFDGVVHYILPFDSKNLTYGFLYAFDELFDDRSKITDDYETEMKRTYQRLTTAYKKLNNPRINTKVTVKDKTYLFMGCLTEKEFVLHESSENKIYSCTSADLRKLGLTD